MTGVNQCYVDVAYHKAVTLLQAGCVFSEFGTRRRRSAKTQEIVMGALLRADRKHTGQGKMNGTSNVISLEANNLYAAIELVLPGTLRNEI